MSARLFKCILIITNLILIVLPTIGIVLSYLVLKPKIVEEYNITLGLYTIAFTSWGLALILASVCLLGIVFTSVICLHLIAALILCCPLALSVWLVVEQFLYRDKINLFVVAICIIASLIWIVQIFSELILACLICCQPKSDGKSKRDEEEEIGDHKSDSVTKIKDDEQGTEEEKEKLVISANETCLQKSPASPTERDDSEENEEEDEDEDGNEEPDEYDQQETDRIDDDDDNRQAGSKGAQSPQELNTMTRDHEISDFQGLNHPQDLPLETIPEEKQNLLQGSLQCPLATPEDTGV